MTSQETTPIIGSLHSGSRKEVEMSRFQEPILKRRKAGKISKKYFEFRPGKLNSLFTVTIF